MANAQLSMTRKNVIDFMDNLEKIANAKRMPPDVRQNAIMTTLEMGRFDPIWMDYVRTLIGTME